MPGIAKRSLSTFVVAIALGGLVGAIVERKLDVLPTLKDWLSGSSRQSVADLQLDAAPATANAPSRSALPVPEKGSFTQWQATTRAKILKLGGSAVTPPPTMTIEYRTLRQRQLETGITQLLIAFRSFDGMEIPAYLHLPAADQRRPGILVVPGHARVGESGIEQLSNGDDSYQHSAARRLAEQGYVTLTPELRGFGYLGQPLETEHRLVAFNAIVRGTSYKWMSLRDMGYAMALLRQLNAVDRQRTAITGASLGGELSVQYAALDPAVYAVLFQSFGGKQGIIEPVRGSGTSQPHYCHTLPIIDGIVKREDWFWMLAGRPVLGVRGLLDSPFTDDVEDVYGYGWSLLNKEHLFELRAADGGHEYFIEPAFEFFAEVFSKEAP